MGALISRRHILPAGAAWGAYAVSACSLPDARAPEPVDPLVDGTVRQQFLASLEPSDVDPGVTAKFHELARTRAWLEATRCSVGNLSHTSEVDGHKRTTRLASAVILDQDGTILFTNHEYNILKTYAGSYAPMNAALVFNHGEMNISIDKLFIDHVDEKHDIAFGRIEANTWQTAQENFGIHSVSLGSTDINALIGQEVILVGYPRMDRLSGIHGSPRLLHATQGLVQRYVSAEQVYNGRSYESFICRVETSAPTIDGISGGAGFVQGLFSGTSASGNFTLGPNPDPDSSFVPLSYSLNLYLQLYPARAQKLGIVGPFANVPESCKSIVSANFDPRLVTPKPM